MDFGTYLKEQIERRNMTQKELANALKISEPAVSLYLKGLRTPRMDLLMKCSRMFGASLEEMLGFSKGEGKMMNFNGLKEMLARNAKSLTDHEKKELMRILIGD